MKLLALCVICGFLGTCSFARKAIEKDSDESSDYSDLLSNAVKGMQALLGNAPDDDDISKSDSNKNKIDSGILQALNEKKHSDENEDDSDDSSEEISLDSIFDGTILKLQRMGEEAVDEFLKSLQDLIGAFTDTEEVDENTVQAIENQVQQSQSNSSNVEEKLNSNEQHKAEQTTETVEKESNGNNIAVKQTEKPVETSNSMQDNKQSGNHKNATKETLNEADENKAQKKDTGTKEKASEVVENKGQKEDTGTKEKASEVVENKAQKEDNSVKEVETKS